MDVYVYVYVYVHVYVHVCVHVHVYGREALEALAVAAAALTTDRAAHPPDLSCRLGRPAFAQHLVPLGTTWLPLLYPCPVPSLLYRTPRPPRPPRPPQPPRPPTPPRPPHPL
jgi:hypothetical protein